jgi:two-component system OmpR family sensor kinase
VTIKARLTLAVVVLVVVLTTVLGFVTIRATRASLVDQIDERLRSIADRPPGPRGNGLQPGGQGGNQAGGADDRIDDTYRDVGEYLYSANGTLLDERPAGFASDPEPAPDLPDPTSPAFADLGDEPFDRPAVSGDLEYRVLIAELRDGNTKVLAEPLTELDEAISSLTRTFVLAGLGVLLVGAAVSWLVIRRGLRPVDRMIDTASAIAGGDLSRRVDLDDDGTELGQLAHALDDMLGQLEASFEERAAAQARLEQFVADASHELRTPVTAIRGYAELYRGGGLGDREHLDRAMTRIEQESVRMGALVEDLLLLARLDEHRPLQHTTVDVRALAADAVSDARAIEPDRPVELRGSGRPVVVRGDEQRLRQVLANLLNNARVHTPAGTPVTVTVEETGGRVRLAVADEGPGIAPADHERIFERFYRADRSRSRESGGSGLGLSIVAAVVTAHGGTVRVESAPGAGTVFTVELPTAGASAPRDEVGATARPVGQD